jgi:hypothetical protein
MESRKNGDASIGLGKAVKLHPLEPELAEIDFRIRRRASFSADRSVSSRVKPEETGCESGLDE